MKFDDATPEQQKLAYHRAAYWFGDDERTIVWMLRRSEKQFTHYLHNTERPRLECYKSLGRVLLMMDGSGQYLDEDAELKPFIADIVIQMDPKEIEVDAEGNIEFVYGSFEIIFDPETNPFGKYGHPYTGDGVERCVNEFLKSLGYSGTVGWSEQGRQSMRLGDFDASYSLFEEVFPEPFARARKHHAAQKS